MLEYILASGIFSILVAIYFIYWVMKKDKGNSKMQEIASAIQEGAKAFLKKQYSTIAIVGLILSVVIFLAYYFTGNIELGWKTAIAFILGALTSGISGFIGMFIAVRANVRVASAATRSLNESLKTAMRSGAIPGILIVSLSLLVITIAFWLYGGFLNPTEVPLLIVGLGFGASLIALFQQLGGGIFTKAADVGADLVGKLEQDIPEDDPRNPAVIADNIGDNVGDNAGRGADLFESIVAENIGAMILGAVLFPVFGLKGILFPLLIQGFGLISSIIGIFFVRTKEDKEPIKALNRGYWITSILSVVGFFIASKYMLSDSWLWFFLAGLVGIITSIIFVYLTQYYTEYRFRPVKSIAESSQTGAATNIITGFSVALESVALPVIVISSAILGSYFLGKFSGIENGGLYGTAVATMGMLVSAAYILSMDILGAISDNAGGIAEMSKAPEETRIRTDKLDAMGNTTKALTKGYAVGSAALAAFLLLSAYMTDVKLESIDLFKPIVFVSGLLGAMLIFLFSALAIRAVGKTAFYIVNEVRRQFREDKGIMEGTSKPDYGRVVDIATGGALKQMVLPGILAIIFPSAIGLILGPEAVGATLVVGTITGIILALTLNTGGGAWDNAKKFIETGAFGGKGSDAHKAAVVGDTVGDPFKDTAGPSLHVLIKLLSTLTLVLAPLFLLIH
jgi:K(+)-stimulated pyrophosphate-energized sodium pump